MTVLTRSTLLVPLALLAVTFFIPATYAAAQDEETDKRPDVGFSTSDQLQSGRDENGNVTMSIKKPPKDPQQTPPVGPIYVVPQINQQGTGPLMPVPGVQQRPGYPPVQRGRLP